MKTFFSPMGAVLVAGLIGATDARAINDVIFTDSFSDPENDPASMQNLSPPTPNADWDATRLGLLYTYPLYDYLKLGVGNNYDYDHPANGERGSTPLTAGDFQFHSTAGDSGFKMAAKSVHATAIPTALYGSSAYIEARFYGVAAARNGSNLDGTSKRNYNTFGSTPIAPALVGLRSTTDPSEQVFYGGARTGYLQSATSSLTTTGSVGTSHIIRDDGSDLFTAFGDGTGIPTQVNFDWYLGADYVVRLYTNRTELYIRKQAGAMLGGSPLPLTGANPFILVDTVTTGLPDTSAAFVPFFEKGTGSSSAESFVMSGFEFYQIPEPASLAWAGLVGVALVLRRRK